MNESGETRRPAMRWMRSSPMAAAAWSPRASTGTVYWEGASLLLEGGRRAGSGYLWMTGDVEQIRL